MTNGPFVGLREQLGNRPRVAIVGFCSTSRAATPYDDPTFEVWGLNRGYMFMPRADRWFEMHGENIWTNQARRPGKHLEWLNTFNGPVYMHQPFEGVKNCEVFPLRVMAEMFGANVFRLGETGTKGELKNWPAIRSTTESPYLSSSIAYEIALAIAEGFEEIHLYGVDLNTEAEYAWQKPGVEYLLGVAAGRGIRVVLPDNCPLLKGTLYGRGYLSERPESMSYEQLATRLKALQHDASVLQEQINKIAGARTELVEFVQAQMLPGIDHERVDERRKLMERHLAEATAKLQQVSGAIQETAYWQSQTMRGQDPDEAIAQLKALDNKECITEGPLTELEELTLRDPILYSVLPFPAPSANTAVDGNVDIKLVPA